MNTVVVHFGCGGLGMGLVVPTLSHLVYSQIYLSNRRHENPDLNQKNEMLRSNRSYDLKSASKIKEISINDFIYFDEINVLKKLVSQNKIFFITTALKETGIEASIPLFAELIETRVNSGVTKPLLFLACENAVNSENVRDKIYLHLKDKNGDDFEFPDYILFCNCVVDKMCNTPIIKENKVHLEAEEYSSWIVDYDPLSLTKNIDSQDLYDLDQVTRQIENYITFTTRSEYYVRRKKWIINSLHQTLALYAHEFNYPLIHRFLLTPLGSKISEKVADDVIKSYFCNENIFGYNKDDIKAYVEEFLNRLRGFPSITSTALTRFKSEKTLESFFSDFHRKTGENANKYYSKTQNRLVSIDVIILKITEMISTRKYVV